MEGNAEVCPVVFAGPSGVGKGTLVKMLMDTYPTLFGFSVSHTTRAPRPGEEDGVHYNFVEKADMEAAIARGDFIEHAAVHTNFYGTSVAAVEKVKSQGKVCILDIDIQGVQSVKKSSLVCKYLFISPPSMADLETRLRGRGTETEEKIQVRMANASQEMEFGTAEGNFDVILVNDQLDNTFAEVVETFKRWFPSLAASL